MNKPSVLGKKIVITGGAGFIGSSVIARMLEGNQITVFDNFFRDNISSLPLINHPNLTIIRGDVLDVALLGDSMIGVDIVIHAAAIAGIDTVIKQPTKTMKVNMLGTANVLEAAYVARGKTG